MPSSTTIVVACAVGIALLVVIFIAMRARAAKEEVQPRFEPPRELAKRPASKDTKEAAKETAKVSEPTTANEKTTPLPKVKTPPIAFPPTSGPPSDKVPSLVPTDEEDEATRIDATPPSTEEVAADEILSSHSARPAAETARPPAPTVPPPLPRSDRVAAMRPRVPTADDGKTEPLPQFPLSEPKVAEPTVTTTTTKSSASAPIATPAPTSAPKLPTSESRLAQAKALPTSQPKVPVATPKLPVSESKVAAAKPLPTSEPKITAATSKLPTSEPKIPAATKSEPKVGTTAEHDFSALNDTPAKPVAAPVPTPAKFVVPSNPATADLEKNDPRHAAARRLARVSVSEIKLYHEDEVKAGREANDLWKRLQQDIALAKSTFEARVAADVRDRFDYLLDEIIRQLAEGEPKKLGPDAPAMKVDLPPAAQPITTPVASPAVALEKATPTPAPAPTQTELEEEAPTKTAHKVLPEIAPTPVAPIVPPVAPVAPVAPEKVAEKPAPTPPASEPKVGDGKPTGIASRLAIAANPETAELEKSDPRHAAARRLARLSVSEIKLYHEDEVKAGRENNDLWKRMITDIGLATQTYDKRVDKEVRERFDYLYDEILRQLAEGDIAKLGREAPKRDKSPSPAPAPAPAVTEAAPAAPTPPASEPKPTAPLSEPKVVPAPEPSSPEPATATPAAIPAAAARYLPPSNPATAELEKNDPRHAAARRLARLSVSEIKLYHEDEVKAGREAKDLWRRLTSDIGLAMQTYEKRVDKEVRERFDYLYDEIVRQLAEGDAAKLGADAPKPKVDA